MVSRKYVLITGASTGIGKDCALYLAERGFDVFAGVRSESDFDSLSSIHKNLRPIKIDVTKLDQIQAAYGKVSELVSPSDSFALINNAGIVKAGPLEHLPAEDFSWQLEVNVTSQVRVAQVFLPLLRQSSDGRIIFTGSQSGFFVSPLMGAYCASKHAIEAVADAYRRELSLNSNIKVSLLQPGQIKTPIWDKSLERKDEILSQVPQNSKDNYQFIMDRVLLRAEDASINGAPTSEVAQCLLHAIESKRPKTRYRMGKGARTTHLLNKILSDRMMDKIIKKALKL